MVPTKIKRGFVFIGWSFVVLFVSISIFTLCCFIWGFGGGEGTIDSLSAPNAPFIVKVNGIADDIKSIRLAGKTNYAYRKFHRGWLLMISGMAEPLSLQAFWDQVDGEEWASNEDLGEEIRSICGENNIPLRVIDDRFSKEDPSMSKRTKKKKSDRYWIVFNSTDGRFTYWTYGSWGEAR